MATVTLPDELVAKMDAIAEKRESSRDELMKMAATLFVEYANTHEGMTPDEVAELESVNRFMTEAARRLWKENPW